MLYVDLAVVLGGGAVHCCRWPNMRGWHMQTPICDASTGRPIRLGDKLRSIEQGDTVRVVEIGQE